MMCYAEYVGGEVSVSGAEQMQQTLKQSNTDSDLENEMVSSSAQSQSYSDGARRVEWAPLSPGDTIADAVVRSEASALSSESSSGRYVSVIRANDIDPAHVVELEDEDEEYDVFEECPPRVLILTVLEGSVDMSTEGVFEDVALVLREGLLRLGVRSVTVRTCVDLRFCSLRSHRFVIV